ncbi:MAG: HAMP domain-containing histidine kinase [Oscillospiraceae bacterium]|nr:HAMP domain-containing histidine kinase [Oscillospiraceae bacterium]
MKGEPLSHRMWAKAAAYVLLTVFAVLLVACGAGIYVLWEQGFYRSTPESLKAEQFRYTLMSAADDVVVRNVVGYPQPENTGNARYVLLDHSGTELWRSGGYDAAAAGPYAWSFVFRWTEYDDGYTEAGYLRDEGTGTEELAETDFIVRAAVDPDLPFQDGFYWRAKGIDLLYGLRIAVYPAAALLLAGVIICFVFLMCGAGHRAGLPGITPGYLYPVPFDVMTAAAAAAVILYAVLIAQSRFEPLLAALPVVAAPVVTGWCASFAMRVKLGGWWKNTLIWRILRLVRTVLRGIWRVVRGIPLVWKTALAAVAVSFIELLWMAGFRHDEDIFFSLWFIEKAVLIAAVLYLALVMRRLQRGGEALARGDLAYHTDTRGMLWDFRRHGEDLNSIGSGMIAAVEERMKSERMKTELITNVSHDIKTPLTSIVNYVDLLKKTDDPAKAKEYLEVLDRQSRRMKKLTEDLVEMSKAASGTVEVKTGRYGVKELLGQALGEYRDRLESAGIEPVLTVPEEELHVRADGKLTWRILDNLFSNVCKYGQRGTRFYVDAAEAGETVRMSFRNISRDPLNKPADELMERFVRGDSARGGEGSGLGLNIAKSLAELQGGRLDLSVDGDLFKAEVTLPAAD